MSKTKKAIKKAISLGLAFALAFLFAAPASAEKKGASLRVVKTDGAAVDGELIAVKGRTIILVDDSSQAYVRLQLQEASQINIKKRSGALLGAVILFAPGAYAGVQIGRSTTPSQKGSFMGSWDKSMAGFYGGLAGAFCGAFIGGGIGALLSMDEKFRVTDMNQEAQDKLLVKLRSKSRFPKEH